MIHFIFIYAFLKMTIINSKKLCLLIIMEGLMVLLIYFCSKFYSINNNTMMIMILIMFMVIESVYGITVLISNSRSTSIENTFMKMM